MSRRQPLQIGLVAMLTLAAAATASAQVCGSYPCSSTPYPYAVAPRSRYQPPGWGTRSERKAGLCLDAQVPAVG